MLNNTISMEHEKNLIMVTWDFTEKSMYALEHAVQMSSMLKGEIAVVHIVKKESEIRDAEKKMTEEVKRKFTDPSLKFHFIVRTGNIFHTIGEIATETNALLVIMGTHGISWYAEISRKLGIKGYCKLKGSLRCCAGIPQGRSLKNIVLPVNLKRKPKNVLHGPTFFAKNSAPNFT